MYANRPVPDGAKVVVLRRSCELMDNLWLTEVALPTGATPTGLPNVIASVTDPGVAVEAVSSARWSRSAVRDAGVAPSGGGSGGFIPEGIGLECLS